MIWGPGLSLAPVVALEHCGGNQTSCLRVQQIYMTFAYSWSFYSQRGDEHCEPRTIGPKSQEDWGLQIGARLAFYWDDKMMTTLRCWCIFHHGVVVTIWQITSRLHKISIKYYLFRRITHCWLLSDQPFVKKFHQLSFSSNPTLMSSEGDIVFSRWSVLIYLELNIDWTNGHFVEQNSYKHFY